MTDATDGRAYMAGAPFLVCQLALWEMMEVNVVGPVGAAVSHVPRVDHFSDLILSLPSADLVVKTGLGRKREERASSNNESRH